MRIKQFIEFADEIVVDISAEDIANALGEDTDRAFTVLRGVNNFASFMNAVPDTIISEFNDSQKKTIKEFFEKQINRLGI